MQDPAIDECFRLLKLRRGADFVAVKQAYRRNLQKCHPDRFQNRVDLLPVAERKTKRLVQVYDVLERWYQSNGGVDPVSSTRAGGRTPDFAADWAPEEDEASPPFSRKVGIGLAAAVVAAVLGAFAWWSTSEPQVTVKPPPFKGVEPAVAPVAPGPAAARPPPQTALQPPAPKTTAALLTAMTAERDRVKSAWVQAYLNDSAARKLAAEKELIDALAQYDRDVRGNAAGIRDADAEIARQAGEWRKDSAAARERFAAQEQAAMEALRADYDAWLLARGNEAVATVQALRRRENSAIGVFSDTEDPRNIFEFWTAEEAGDPEINIAAKTGVEVRQPDERFFPHFRSNIFLYDPEGRTLVRMMESIVARHGALEKQLGERKAGDEVELANWDTAHPAGAPRLSGAQESAIAARDNADGRLSAAKARLAGAALAAGGPAANKAFDQSPIGLKWAERITAVTKSPGAAGGPH